MSLFGKSPCLLITDVFSQGNQLRRDLNEIIGRNNNWNIPSFWGPLIRYVSAPILAIVYSFSYPSFYQLREDPLHILGFGVGHIALLVIGSGFIVPRWLDVLIPSNRKGDGKLDIGANVSPRSLQSEGNDGTETPEKHSNSDGDTEQVRRNAE